LNVFPAAKNVLLPRKPEHPGIKLFWFSQTISAARGVDDCINALRMLNNPEIELHLLGYADAATRQQLTNNAGDKVNLVFHSPIGPDEIIRFASKFDIGLAMEHPTPYNRDICLTNKIFTYMQAGLAVIASNTIAQRALMGQYPETGKIYKSGNIQSLANAISNYADNRNELYSARKASYDIACEKLNWEKESEKFLSLVNKILAN
jgi:glycosyltransferase involved in cell wall biosynthesis